MTFTELSKPIFEQAIADYHVTDNVDTPIQNPYPLRTIEYYLYLKKDVQFLLLPVIEKKKQII